MSKRIKTTGRDRNAEEMYPVPKSTFDKLADDAIAWKDLSLEKAWKRISQLEEDLELANLNMNAYRENAKYWERCCEKLLMKMVLRVGFVLAVLGAHWVVILWLWRMV